MLLLAALRSGAARVEQQQGKKVVVKARVVQNEEASPASQISLCSRPSAELEGAGTILAAEVSFA